MKTTNTEVGTTTNPGSAPFLGNANIERQNIEKIVFKKLNSMDEAPTINNITCWDVSDEQDESILAWYEETSAPYTVNIGSDSIIFANSDSSRLFSYIGFADVCDETVLIEGIELLNVSNVQNMNHMFYFFGVSTMTTLDLGSNFDTRNVIYMSHMFDNCGYNDMTTLNLGSKFDTSSVEDMSAMFNRAGRMKLQNFKFGDESADGPTYWKLGSKFDTSSVKNMAGMFGYFGYYYVQKFDLGDNFNTINVTDMSSMFYGTGFSKMVTLDLGDNFDTRNVEDMENMFSATGRHSMERFDLGDKFYTTSATNMKGMFSYTGSDSMIELDLGPAFTRIASTNTGFTNEYTGKENEVVIHVPETIYSSKTAFRLDKDSSTTLSLAITSEDGVTPVTYKGTLNPKYRPEWIIESSTIDLDAKTAEFEILGTVDIPKYTEIEELANQINVTINTLSKDTIKVLADGTEVTTGITKTVTLLSTGTNATTGAIEARYKISVSGFETGASQLKVQIPKATLVDTPYGNKSIADDLIIYSCIMTTNTENTADSNFLGNSNIQRQDIENITFVDNIDEAPRIDYVTCWDVSAQQDESIIAWYKETSAPYTVYIGSNTPIFANPNSSYLFAFIGSGSSCDDTKAITNLGTLNTDIVLNMTGMFRAFGQNAMTSLDLGDNFDTSTVTNMSRMFYGCGQLKMATLNLGSNFDTSLVEDMSYMFRDCGKEMLTELNLYKAKNAEGQLVDINFDTSKTKDMQHMFYNTGFKCMTDINFGEQFDTSLVEKMNHMFYATGRTLLKTFIFGTQEYEQGYWRLGDKFNTANVNDMNNMFAYFAYNHTLVLDLGDQFYTSKVEYMQNMFYGTGFNKMTNLYLGDNFDTTNVTNMQNMFAATGRYKMVKLDLGDKFYTNNANNMNNMFAYTGQRYMTELHLGPAFTKIADSHTAFTNEYTGKSGELVIYAPESIYFSETEFKLNAEATTSAWEITTGTINPYYRPEWVTDTVTVDKTNGMVDITLKGTIATVQKDVNGTTVEEPKYLSNVTGGTIDANVLRVYIGDIDVTDSTIPTLTKLSGVTGTEENEITHKTEAIGYKVRLSNLDDAVRRAGIPYNEWSGEISLVIDGRGQATNTYTKQVLLDEYGNQSMSQLEEGGTWIDIKIEHDDMYVDFIKPEFRYESAKTEIIGTPDSADTADAEKYVTVLFDVLDKYYSGSTLGKDDITLKVIDTDPAVTVDASKFTRALALKTIDTETTNATSGLTYKTNGDIYYDVDGDGIADKVGQRYELTISGLDQKNGFDYSGPMSITFSAGKVTDSSSNSNAATTITIGIDETDGDATDGGDGGSQEIVDLVNPVWTVGNKTTTTAADGTTTANIEMIVTDKYFKTSTLTEDQIQVLVDGEDKASELDITFTGPTEVENGHKYVFTFSNFEETYNDFIEEREKYLADSSTGRLYREFSGPVQVVVPKGAAVDDYGNDSEALTVDLGNIDTLKPEVVKVSSSVEIIEKTDDTNNTTNPNNIEDSKQTIVFDITDKYLVSSSINGDAISADGAIDLSKVDTSEIHVLIDDKEAESVTKTITNIQILKATINENEKIIGYRYTLELTDFKKVKSESDVYTNWSGNVSIKIGEGAATDSSGSGNAATTITGEYVDFVNPDITYKFAETDIDYDNKSFKMQFEITDKYFSYSTLELDNLTILIDSEDGQGYQPFNDKVEKSLEITDIKADVEGVNKVVGKSYTLLLENLEQEDVQYSGIVSVTIPAGVTFDSTKGDNSTDPKQLYNNAKTITSGIDVIGDIDQGGDAEVIDVVDPVWEKVESSANAINKTATIKVKGTDKYYASSSLTNKIKVYVNGTTDVTSSVTITPSTATPVYKATDSTVQVGDEYTITVTGFDSDVNQVKITILEGAMKDTAGNNSKATDMILYNCLDLTDTENAEDSVFLGHETLKRQNIEKVTFVELTQAQMSAWATSITADDSYWDVSAQGDKSIVAYYKDEDSNNAYEVEIGSHWEIFANQNSSYLFSYVGYGTDCETTVTVGSINLLNTNSVTNMAYMFNNFGYRAMTGLHLGEFDTTNVTNMAGMFAGCGNKAMTVLDLGTKFDTSKVTDMSNMFNGCGQNAMTEFAIGTSTNIIDFTITTDTDKTVNMSGMFQNFGQKLASLTLGENFNTTRVTDMSNMFNGCGQSLLTEFSLGANFNTAKVTNMSGMFQDFAYQLKALDLGNYFYTSEVINMSNMFNGCAQTSMKTLTLGNNFNTSKVTDMSGMFQNCGKNKLESLDLGDLFYTTTVTNMTGMFYGCGDLAMTVLDLGPAFTKIATQHDGFMTDCGTADIVIYAPEAIYSNNSAFK